MVRIYVYNMKQNNVWFSRYEVEINELADNNNNSNNNNNNNNHVFNNNNNNNINNNNFNMNNNNNFNNGFNNYNTKSNNNGLNGYEKGTIVLVNRDKAVLSWNGKAPDILFFVSLERFVVGLITEDKLSRF